MKNVRLSFFHHPIIDQRGQVLPWVAFMMVLFVGIGAFVLDIGHAFMSYRQLQAATDAAALAGARDIYDSTAISTAETFAATTGGSNYYSTLQNVSMVPGWPKLECLTTVTIWESSARGRRGECHPGQGAGDRPNLLRKDLRHQSDDGLGCLHSYKGKTRSPERRAAAGYHVVDG